LNNSKELADKISKLKKERKAVLLVHNYQRPEIQDIGDFTGDSLALSRQASTTDAKVIVFCGVRFMAETASILCPDKTVLLPAFGAGCPLADKITAEQLRKLKSEHPGAEVVSYVNSSAEVKAESTIICTSANSIKVVNSLPAGKEIIFVPDRNLGLYTAEKTKRKMVIWDGGCPIHTEITVEDIKQQSKKYPSAKVMVHPECNPEVLAAADAVVSTGGMLKYAAENPATEFIVGTETSMLYPLAKSQPGKKFYPAREKAVCEDMQKTTLELVLSALEKMSPEIKVKDEIRAKAVKAVRRMLDLEK